MHWRLLANNIKFLCFTTRVSNMPKLSTVFFYNTKKRWRRSSGLLGVAN